MESVHRRLVESIVQGRFGQEGLRVFRMLLHHGKMQPDQIAMSAMMSQVNVNSLLNCMFDAGFVELQVRGSSQFATTTRDNHMPPSL